LEAGESAVVKFRVKGLDTTTWTVQVDIDCKGGAPVKLLPPRNGTIGTPGGGGFDETVNIKPNPCGQ